MREPGLGEQSPTPLAAQRQSASKDSQNLEVMWPFHGHSPCPLSLGAQSHHLCALLNRKKPCEVQVPLLGGCQGTMSSVRCLVWLEDDFCPAAASPKSICGGPGWVAMVAPASGAGPSVPAAMGMMLVVVPGGAGERIWMEEQRIWELPMRCSSRRALKAKLGSCFRRDRRTEKQEKGW